MNEMKPPFDKCRSYSGIEAFLAQNMNRVIRFYVYRRMFTPMEDDMKYCDQSVYESTTASIGMIRETIPLPNGDVLLGIGMITDEVSDMDYLEYYRLSEVRLSYWPKDNYAYGASDEDTEESV